MNSRAQRLQILCDIQIAVAAGARYQPACACIGLSIRTLQRWQNESTAVDLRPFAPRKPPAHALSAAERARIIALCNQPEYASSPPSQIVPKLADQGIYLASESSFNRILRPTFFMDFFRKKVGRKVVAWEIHAAESGEFAAQLMAQAKLREGFKAGLVLHSDNGAAMKSQTLWVKMQELGMAKSYSRPGVSNDNPHIESFFRTLKYTPKWPSKGFKNLVQARDWTLDFIGWYNTKHQHSSLNFVTPEQRHLGLDAAILGQRDALYLAAKTDNPARWSGKTRSWKPVGAMALNPCKKEEILMNSDPIAA